MPRKTKASEESSTTTTTTTSTPVSKKQKTSGTLTGTERKNALQSLNKDWKEGLFEMHIIYCLIDFCNGEI